MSRSKFFRYDEESGDVVEFKKEKVVHRARWPLAVEALAVHPSQIDEAREQARAAGVSTDFRSDGTPIMTGPGHYKQYRKHTGYHQRNGYES